MFEKNQEKHLIFLALISIFSYLCFNGTIASILDNLYYNHIYAVNNLYLEASLKDTTELYETLSGLKVLFSILSSSSGGISFIVDAQVQLGEFLNVVDSLFTKAWVVSLAVIYILKLMVFILEFSKIIMPYILSLFSITFGLSYALKPSYIKLAYFMGKISMIWLFIALFIYVVVPFFIYFSSIISHTHFTDQKVQRAIHFKNIYSTFNHKNQSLHDDISSSMDYLKENKKQIKEKNSFYSKLTIEHVFYTFLEFVLIPIILIIVLSYISVVFVRNLLIFYKKEP